MSTSRSLRRVFDTTVGARARLAGRSISPVGWSLLIAGVCAAIIGHFLGWAELTAFGVTALVVLALAAPFALGQTELEVELDVRPPAVTVGQRAAAQITVRPGGTGPVRSVTMELRVGDTFVEFPVPTLRQGSEHEEPFVLPTFRRGVITVGPASSVRGDPLGIVRRTQTWTDEVDLIVHPRTVRLADTGQGFVRDLEGIASNDRSDADISFHALRTYEPGDDPRHIHWLSTARTGTLMVRQFVDTRRSHLGLAVDTDPASYDSNDDFEVGMSIAASLGCRVLADEQEVTCVVGADRVLSDSRRLFLDSLARADAVERAAPLGACVAAMMKASSGLSLAAVITGARTNLEDLRRATLRFPSGIPVMVIRVDRNSPTTYRPIGNQVLLSVREIEEFPHLLWAVSG